MRVTAQPACVLHVRAWRETSLLVEAFSRDFGRVGLVARGVRGPRARLSRALLEPLQPLRLDWGGRGELATLAAVEPAVPPRAYPARALTAAMYVNELVVRLTARNDPQPGLFARYLRLLDDLAGGGAVAWPLRCFERDLLVALGYAPVLDIEAGTGTSIDAAREYDYVPGEGANPAGSGPAGVRLRGSALLALAAGREPDAADQAALRRLMRALLGAQLGGRGLQSWRVLAGPARDA